MGHEFDSQIDVTAERDGTYAADLSGGWVVGGGVNGGYLPAVIRKAVLPALSGMPDPIAASGH